MNPNLEQELIQTEDLPNSEIESTEETLPSLEDLKEGKISLKEIPYHQRIELESRIREDLPDDDAKEAFDFGWRPKEFFLGKKADGSTKEFVDYKDFLKKVREVPSVKNERMRALSKEKTLSKENEDLRKLLEESKSQMKNLFELNKMTQERELSSQEEILQTQLQEAEELGDIKTFKAVQAKLNNLEQAKNKFKTFEQPRQIEPEIPQINSELLVEAQDWTAKNPWYVENPQLRPYFEKQSALLAETASHLTLTQRLDFIKQTARSLYPDLIPSAPKQMVLSGKTTGFNSAPKTSMSFEQLPEAERKTAEWLIKAKVYKSKSEAVQAYMKREKEKGAK